MTITLADLEARLRDASTARMDELLAGVMTQATSAMEDRARANMGARLKERSRSLINSLRSELLTQNGEVVGRVLAGGDYAGLRVPYAAIHEYGGTILPVRAKHLSIPVEAGLTGPGIARYKSVRQMPFAAFRPVKNSGKLKWIVYDKRNKHVFFLLVTDVTLQGQRFMRDALDETTRELPERLARAARAALGVA